MEHELEFIERRMCEDIHAAADDGLKKRLKLGAHEVGCAFVSVAGALPASAIVINISYGLGLEQAARHEQVSEISGTMLRQAHNAISCSCIRKPSQRGCRNGWRNIT